ncbi:MAG: ethylbenzene dehydrogenase-related protein [Acidimicrobiia bacterium]|nr:MAG: ethylbenzene dehydrogenase-related protein [Acidimicrobiia bacterium]
MTKVFGNRRWMLLLVALVAAAGLRVLDANPAAAQTQSITAWRSEIAPGLDSASEAWQQIPPVQLRLTAQNVTTPMGGGSIPLVSVRALHHEGTLYVNLQWADSTANTDARAVDRFVDAVAVQFPGLAAATVPAICMGQADGAVNIWYWRADGGGSVLPYDGYVDYYLAEDATHYPPQAAGNVLTGTQTVQNLIAGGFGSLTPLDQQAVEGAGAYDALTWSVTMARTFAAPGADQPSFVAGAAIDVAFAVWDGAQADRNGQKSVSSFARMQISDSTYGNTASGGDGTALWMQALYVLGALATVLFLVGITRKPKPNG